MPGVAPYDISALLDIVAGASGHIPLAYAVVGQSTERGQVDPAENIAGVSSLTTFPQAYRSQRSAGISYPVSPGMTKVGGRWFKFYDDMFDWGYDAQMVNSGVGSASFVTDIVGQIATRANSTGYRAKRASIGPGDRGFGGDFMVNSGKVFVCTTGRAAYCMNFGTEMPLDPSHVPELDYTRVIGTQATAAADPGTFAAANVGDVIVDGTISWTCLSITTTYKGYSYVAGNPFTESRAGFDPYGILRRTHELMQTIRGCPLKVVQLQNGQSDTSYSASVYTSFLNQAAAYFLNRGYTVMFGLTIYSPLTTTTAYNNLTTGVNNSLAQSIAAAGTGYAASQCKAGANLYTLLGSTGNTGGSSFNGTIVGTALTINSLTSGVVEIGQLVTGVGVTVGTYITAGAGAAWTVGTSQNVGPVAMLGGGAYFAKDNQDVLHDNAPGAIAAGAANATALKAFLPQVVR